MLINWFTVVAQIINFLVLVWLLKHFLYGPVIAFIKARESKIAARVAEAEAKEAEAARQLSRYQAQLAEIQQQRDDMLAQARREAGQQQSELVAQARAAVLALETKWREDVEQEREAFLLDLRNRAAAEILAIVRHTVADLAGVEVQQSAVQTFLGKLRELDGKAWASLGAGDLVIRSAFALPEDTRREIQRAIAAHREAPVRLEFEQAPELVLGLEVRGEGQRIGWNSESYLEALERDLNEALEHSPGHTHAEVA